MLTFLAAAALATPQPGALKTFEDWTVGCDNGRVCQAVALLPENSFVGASLALRREPLADAPIDIWVTARGDDGRELEPAAILIDGRRFALVDRPMMGLTPRDSQAVAALLGHARRIELLDAAGKLLGHVSVQGSAAALLYMDAQQRRIGTRSALVRRGPASAVPPPPSRPEIVTPRAPATRPRGLAQARLRQLLGSEATVCEYAQRLEPETVRLDARTSLVIANHPCGNGAYNIMFSAWLVDERGRVRRPTFDHQTAMGEGDDVMLVNAGWDAERRFLTSFAKGRGVSDCGVGQSYAWDGARFRLVEQNEMGECRGSTDYITTWRALVVER